MRARGGVGTHWQPLNTLKTPRKCKPGVGSGQVGARCQPLGKQPHGTELAPPRQAGSADNSSHGTSSNNRNSSSNCIIQRFGLCLPGGRSRSSLHTCSSRTSWD